MNSKRASISDPDSMAWLWRKYLRPMARKHSLPEFYLAHDALENLGNEWDLKGVTGTLSAALTSFSYEASPPVFVRAAKAVGLTRPIAHLSFVDALVYRTLVARAETSLAQSVPKWARMGRRDESDGGLGGESGWFRAWLARQQKIWVMAAKSDWLVESDIANYYQTIDLAQLSDHVRTVSKLSDEASRLLQHTLERFSPFVEYRRLAAGGLAQEFSDSSRILAHSYISTLDHAFTEEGKADRYSRWVDDVIVGADSWAEALWIVRRIQLELEKLGLHPNTSKTRIYRRSEFIVDYMKQENDFLGEVEAIKPPTAHLQREFRRRLDKHVRLSAPRPKGWGRVLRRYYTNSRRLGDRYLLDHWGRHLAESPESAGHILEYVRASPLTQKKLKTLGSVLAQFGGVYEDVEILAMEFLATAPIGRDRVVRDEATGLALSRASGATRYGPEVAAAAAVAVAKMGTRAGLIGLTRMLPSALEEDSAIRRQLLPIGFSLGWIDEKELRAAGFDAVGDAVRQIRFLLAIVDGDKKAIDMSFGVLKPTQRMDPKRWVVRPRLLFLAPLLSQVDRAQYLAKSSTWLSQLGSNPPDLRDRCAEGWLRFAAVSSRP